MNNPLLQRLASSVLAILLLIYVGYQVYNSKNKGFQLETAAYFTASDSIQVNGIPLRKEMELTTKASGVIDYALENGEKIEKGGMVAYIYSNSQQATARRGKESTDREIIRLQNLQSPGSTLAASPDVLNKKISRYLTDAVGEAFNGNFSSIETSKEELLYLINERQVIAGEVTDFKDRITALQEKSKEYAGQAGTAEGTVTAPASGYFIEDSSAPTDGDLYNRVLQLTAEEVSGLEKQQSDSGDSLGKICTDYDWYFVCTVSADQAAVFRQRGEGASVSINFPFVSDETIPAILAAVNQSGQDGDAAVILQCDYMNSALASIRNETARIILQKESGIRVSRKAIHFEKVTKQSKDDSGQVREIQKEVQGVYVLRGSEICFTQILPLYSTDSYVVCDPSPPKEDLMTERTVKLNDEVVVEGTDLYDGKVVQ